MGIKAFRDPALTQDFDAPRLAGRPGGLPHLRRRLGRREVACSPSTARRSAGARSPPTYPMQAMVAVYDFPEWSVGDDDHLVPELVVDHVAG